jgi:hypothetical protein
MLVDAGGVKTSTPSGIFALSTIGTRILQDKLHGGLSSVEAVEDEVVAVMEDKMLDPDTVQTL